MMNDFKEFKSAVNAKIDKINQNIDRKLPDLQLVSSNIEKASQIIQETQGFNNLEDDFQLIREKLINLTNLTSQMLTDIADGIGFMEKPQLGYHSFAQIASIQNETLKLFANTYKDLQDITSKNPKGDNTFNILNVEAKDRINVSEVIKKLKA